MLPLIPIVMKALPLILGQTSLPKETISKVTTAVNVLAGDSAKSEAVELAMIEAGVAVDLANHSNKSN